MTEIGICRWLMQTRFSRSLAKKERGENWREKKEGKREQKGLFQIVFLEEEN